MTTLAAKAPSSAFDVESLRAQFPILGREVHGAPLVYFDNAASAQKPRAVIDAMRAVMESGYANVHRGLHTLSNEATSAYEKARESAARFLNAGRAEEIVFTMGGTDAINLVAYALGAGGEIGDGDEIILSVSEHHSNIVPWHFLRARKGAVLKWLDVDDDGSFDLKAYEALFTRRTKFVAISHMSNVFGVPQPAAELARIAHAHGAKILFDGCQAAVHAPVDVRAIDADFYVATGHKLYGPTGIGLLYGKYDLLADMQPYRGGGEMIETVTTETVTYNEPPHRFEAGTPPIVEAIGLGAALDWLMALPRDAIAAHEKALTEHLMEGLKGLNWARAYGQAPEKSAIVAFNIDGAHPHDVSSILDRQGVAVRAGHHCAQPLMRRLDVSATARASLAAYNTHAEADAFIEALRKAHDMLG